MRESRGIQWLESEEEKNKLLAQGDIILVAGMRIYAKNSSFTFRQCSGIDNLFKKAVRIAKELNCGIIYNPTFNNGWLGHGAIGFFEFYRLNKNPSTPYRGYHGI